MSSSLGNLQFKEILQDPENLCCFDCGKTPAQWASINNSIFYAFHAAEFIVDLEFK